MTICLRAVAVMMLAACAPAGLAAQMPAADVEAITAFQRSADAYAFTHRQTDRRGTTPDRRVEGEFFTPRIAAVFRARIRGGLLHHACDALPGTSFVVPPVNAGIENTEPVSSCLGALLPKLPEELEYRVAGVALVLADAHRHVVVDVLHAAFSRDE